MSTSRPVRLQRKLKVERFQHGWIFSLASLSLWFGYYHGAAGLSAVVTVAPYQDECFLFRTPASWKEDMKRNPRYAYGSFEIISAKQLVPDPLIVYLTTYTLDKMLYRSTRGQDSGHFDVLVEPSQKYWFCIVNSQGNNLGGGIVDDDVAKNPNLLPQKVGFSLDLVTGHEFDYVDVGGNPIDPGLGETERDKVQRLAKEKADEWLRTGIKLGQRLKDMKHHFDYLRVREAAHREVTEQTFTDILAWTALEVATVTLVAVGQVMYFRRFLERKNLYSVFG